MFFVLLYNIVGCKHLASEGVFYTLCRMQASGERRCVLHSCYCCQIILKLKILLEQFVRSKFTVLLPFFPSGLLIRTNQSWMNCMVTIVGCKHRASEVSMVLYTWAAVVVEPVTFAYLYLHCGISHWADI